MSGRVLVPWKEILDELDDREMAAAGLRAEVFSGDQPLPDDLGDVVFFTVPYDQPYGTEPLPRMPGARVIQALTAGYDDLLGKITAGATLCNARGLHDASTAEHALGLISWPRSANCRGGCGPRTRTTGSTRTPARWPAAAC